MDFSFQLYSARDAGPLETTLKTLKDLGYAQVEGWGGQFSDPAGLAQSLKSVGLTMPTAHMGFAQLEDTAAAIRIAQTVGIKTVYCPAPPSADFRNGTGDWRQFGASLARIGQALRGAGIGFGYHNHHWEFARDRQGNYPLDLLLEAAPDLEWEVDLAWVVKGNQEPIAWIEKYAPRVTAVHVKDIAPPGEAEDEDGWADVGHGTLDWPTLFRQIREKTNAKYFVMEHDKPNDADRFARRSIETVRKWS